MIASAPRASSPKTPFGKCVGVSARKARGRSCCQFNAGISNRMKKKSARMY